MFEVVLVAALYVIIDSSLAIFTGDAGNSGETVGRTLEFKQI